MSRTTSGPPAASREEVRKTLRAEIDRLEAALREGVPPQLDAAPPVSSRRVLPHSPAGIERELRLLRQLEAGLDRLDEETIPRDRAGLGSRVYVRDVPSGRERAHNLVLGERDPRDAGQLSIDSPLGRALLGTRPGDEAEARLGERQVRVRVFNVRTLPRRLGMPEAR